MNSFYFLNYFVNFAYKFPNIKMTRVRRYITILVVAVLFNNLLNGQVKILQDYYARFKHLTVADGLPGNHVTTLLQDRNLFVWIGTTEGLTRYDGHSFIEFVHNGNDSTSLPDNYITCLKQDSIGNIWVGTKNGLAYYSPTSEHFTTIPLISETGRGISNNHIRAILPGSYPMLWVETVDGNLHHLNSKTFVSKIYHHNRVAQPYYDYHAIFKDSYDKLWIGGRNLGPEFLDLQTNRFITITTVGNSPSQKRDHDVACYFEDSKNNFWVSATDGFYHYDRVRDVFTKKLATSTFQIAEDDSQNLWLATGGGLYRFNPQEGQFTRFAHLESDPVSISSNHLYCLMIDKEGNIWTGTNDGVNILLKNQTYVRHFRQIPSLKHSLSNNRVTSFFELNDTTVYIGTDGGGMNRMNTKTEMFEAFTPDASDQCAISSNRVSIIKGNEKQLWVGLWQGVGFNRFDIKSSCFTRYAVSPNTRKVDWYNDFYDDGGDTLWCGIWGGRGIHLFDKKAGKFLDKNFRPTNNPDDLPLYKQFVNGNFIITTNNRGVIYLFDDNTSSFNGYVSQSQVDFAQKLKLKTADIPAGVFKIFSGITVDETTLILTSKGLIFFDRSDTSFHSVKNIDYPCYAITPSRERHSFWIGTDRGLEYYDHQKHKAFLVEKASNKGLPLSNRRITALHLINSSQLLIGTSQGLLTYNPLQSKFVPPPGEIQNSELANMPIKQIKQLYDNRLYFLLKRGFAYSTPGFDTIRIFNVSNSFGMRMPTDIIFDIVESATPNIILLATDIGLIQYSSDSAYFSSNLKFKDYSIQSLERLGNKLSVCTNRGYLQYCQSTDSVMHFNYPSNDCLTSHLISFLFKDSKGFVWAGTTNRGVNRINPVTGYVSHYFEGNGKGFAGKDAQCIMQTKSGQIFVGGEKVNLYDDERDMFVEPDFAKALPDEPVIAMLEDEQSNLWIITNNTIYRYNSSDRKVTDINKLLGFKYISFTKGVARLHSGKFLIGTKQGFLQFYPNRIKRVKNKKAIQITGVSILGKRVAATVKTGDRIRLNYDENFVEINYSAMNYSPVEITYEYMLDGIDKDWVKTTKPFASYTKIQPGNYLFKVRDSDSPEKSLTTFVIKIDPPFWQTWWFILTIILIGVSLLIYWWKQRLNRVRVMENNLNLKQRLLLSQLNPHFIFNILTAIQGFIYQNKPQESGRYLSKFAKLMRLVLENMRSDYNPVEKEVEMLTYYLEMQKLRFNDIFDFKITTSCIADETNLALPTMILQPIVENSVEHGVRGMKGEGLILVDFTIKDNKWLITVEDNGSGYYPGKDRKTVGQKAHKSVSTTIIKERIEGFNKHAKKVEYSINYENLANSNSGKRGTRVTLILPVLNEKL